MGHHVNVTFVVVVAATVGGWLIVVVVCDLVSAVSTFAIGLKPV